ncbi:MAG: CorA family divalent cation transporter [Chloroflexota bacterium]
MTVAAPARPALILPAMRGVAHTGGKAVEFTTREGLASALRDAGANVWVDVTAPEGSSVGDIAAMLDLHPLIAEDIAERNQRAKFEEIEGTIHIVMFAVSYVDGEIRTTEVDLVLGQRSLLTVHEEGWDPFALDQLRGDPGAVVERGVDYLLYAITDGLVDALFPVMDAIEDEIDELQDDVIRKATPATLERLLRPQAPAHRPAP